MNSADSSFTDRHYEHLAATYDAHWAHSQANVGGMTDLIVQHLRPEPSHTVADIGGGTGIFAKALMERVDLRNPVKVVDPSPSMLANLDASVQIETIVGDADSFSERGERVDRILIKEAVHHFPDPSMSLSNLARCLTGGGRLLIVMLPQRIRYPLFQAALKRFERLQPNHLDIADALRDGQLDVEIAHHTLNQALPTERYIQMVEGRYMSLLSEFSDEELSAGVEEMRRTLTGDTVTFPDDFVFLTGIRRGA